ncbi:unnamed protein product, partial [Discosporangium mesarthrocarpum]
MCALSPRLLLSHYLREGIEVRSLRSLTSFFMRAQQFIIFFSSVRWRRTLRVRNKGVQCGESFTPVDIQLQPGRQKVVAPSCPGAKEDGWVSSVSTWQGRSSALRSVDGASPKIPLAKKNTACVPTVNSSDVA